MKTRSLLILLAIALVALPGCGKVRNLFHRKPAEPVAAATPVVAKPAPTATPEATPVSTSNRSANVVVLCYHRFEDLPRDYLAIKPSEFEAQMQGIKDNGFTVIPMKDFLAWRRGEKEIPAKSALITIDDGYVSAYNVAWPILKKFGYPFSMFVYIQYIGSGGKSITWDQLAEMRDAGVDIGCHSWSHQKKLGYEGWLKKEIVESKQLLEKNLAIKVETFTYPYGIYNQKARDFVKTAGYELAFTVYGQRIGFSAPASDLIGRYAISTREPHIFQSAMNMVGGGSSGYAAAAATPAMAQLAASSMATEPMEGETVSDPKPLLKANLATMGAVEPGSVEMRISGFGLVPCTYDAASKTVSYKPTTQPLRDKNYTVIISAKVGGKKVETRWSFNFDPAATPAPAASNAGAPAAAPAPVGGKQ